MTREEAAKWAELYQAYADGKTIQYLCNRGIWVDGKTLSFTESEEKYRIKPEMKKVDVWLNVYEDGRHCVHTSRKDADTGVAAHRICCLHIVREYEEGEGL